MDIVTNNDEINKLNNELFVNLKSDLNDVVELKLKYKDFQTRYNNFNSSLVYFNDKNDIWFAVDKNKNKIRYYFGMKDKIQTKSNTEADFVFHIDTLKPFNGSVLFARENNVNYILITLLSQSKILQLRKIGFKIESLKINNRLGNKNFIAIPIDKNLLKQIINLKFSIEIKFYSYKGIIIKKVLTKENSYKRDLKPKEIKICEICGNKIIPVSRSNNLLKDLMKSFPEKCNICLEKISAVYAFDFLSENLENDYELFENLNSKVNDQSLFDFYINLLKKYDLISNNDTIFFLQEREDLISKFLPFIDTIPEEFELSFL